MITQEEKKAIAHDLSLRAAAYPHLNFLLEVYENDAPFGAEVVRLTAGPWDEEEEA